MNREDMKGCALLALLVLATLAGIAYGIARDYAVLKLTLEAVWP